MNTIPISEFRANMVSALEAVKQGEHIELTSHGKAVAMLVPVQDTQHKAESVLQKLSETAQIFDILSPIDEQWDALDDPS